MLALERNIGESIIIDDSIEVKIVDIRSGGRIVRLGITAPRSISVHRKEIQEAIIKERQSCGVGNKRINAVSSVSLTQESQS